MATPPEEYEKMLDRALAALPKRIMKGERFEVPSVDVLIIGNQTFVNNFAEVCDTLRRKPEHVLKFLAKELATAASLRGLRAVFQGRFSEQTIHGLINRYVGDYVLCSICKRPDTKLQREKRFLFLVCEACGAKSSARPL